MSKLWLIAQRHYRQEVLKRGFLMALLSLPLFLGVSIGFGFLFANLNREQALLGYVDPGNIIRALPEAKTVDSVDLIHFASPELARQALESGEVVAYYVLSDPTSRPIETQLVYISPPDRSALRYFADVVRFNLLAGQAPETVDRVMSGTKVTVWAADSGRAYPDGDPTAGTFAPLIAAVLFAFLLMAVGGTLMQALVEERENRTMEVIVTSVSPREMMAGKILAVSGVALTLLLAWLAFLVAAIWVGGALLDVQWLQDISVDWRQIGGLALVALPSLLAISALMFLLGSTIVNSEEAQQAGPLMMAIMLMPLYLILPIAMNPDGPVALVFSLIPVTAVSTLAIRGMFAAVPFWQVSVAAAIALVSALSLMVLAGKVFRANMLRYGQRFHLGELLGRPRRHNAQRGA